METKTQTQTQTATTYFNGGCRPSWMAADWQPETLRIAKSVLVNHSNTYGPYTDGRFCHDAVHLTDCGRAFFQRAWRVGSTPGLNAVYELQEAEMQAYGVAELAAKLRDGAQ